MEKRCDNCQYWHPLEFDLYSMFVQGRQKAGACRIGPPERDKADGVGKWPLTVCTDYCGLFAANEGN